MIYIYIYIFFFFFFFAFYRVAIIIQTAWRRYKSKVRTTFNLTCNLSDKFIW